MDNEHFAQIDKFLAARRKSELIPFAYVIFIDNVKSRLSKVRRNEISDELIEEACQSYLTDAALENSIHVCEKQKDALQNDSQVSMGFLKSLGTSILANVLFSLLLYILYTIAISPSANEQIDAIGQGITGDEAAGLVDDSSGEAGDATGEAN